MQNGNSTNSNNNDRKHSHNKPSTPETKKTNNKVNAWIDQINKSDQMKTTKQKI